METFAGRRRPAGMTATSVTPAQPAAVSPSHPARSGSVPSTASRQSTHNAGARNLKTDAGEQSAAACSTEFCHIPAHAAPPPARHAGLTVSWRSDPSEQEADQVAQQVIQMPAGLPLNDSQMKAAYPNAGQQRVQTKRVQAGGSLRVAVPYSVYGVLARPGRPLDRATREFMEPRFGHDFSHVRVHSDSEAQQSAREMRAHAYTVGSNIVFAHGRDAAGTPEGRSLLAHELTHVVQQSGADSSNGVLQRSSADSGFAPKSLTTNFDPRSLSDEELQAETLKVNDWLSKQAKRSDVESEQMIQALHTLEAEVNGRQSKQAAPKQPLLPTVKSEGKADLVAVMKDIEGIHPSDVASGLFTVMVDGRPRSINPEQVAKIRREAANVLKDHLRRVEIEASSAKSGYDSQSDVDKKHWFFAPIVKTLGRIKDPGPYLIAAVEKADSRCQAALKAVDEGNLARAAALLADGEASAISANKLWQAYFQGIINAGEMTVTVLEITSEAAFISLGILAVIASGGAAAGALGLGGTTATTTAFGFEVGTVAAANTVAASAPIVANLGAAAVKTALGDKVDWGMVVVDTAVQVLLARFGGKATAGIGKAIAGNPATRTLASKVTEKVVHAAVMHIGSTALMTAAQDTYLALKGQNITWQTFIDQTIDRLTDPKGLAIAAVTAAVTSVAEAKYGPGTSRAGAGKPSAPPEYVPAGASAEPTPKAQGTSAPEVKPSKVTPIGEAQKGFSNTPQLKRGERETTSLDEFRARRKAAAGPTRTPPSQPNQQVQQAAAEEVQRQQYKLAAGAEQYNPEPASTEQSTPVSASASSKSGVEMGPVKVEGGSSTKTTRTGGGGVPSAVESQVSSTSRKQVRVPARSERSGEQAAGAASQQGSANGSTNDQDAQSEVDRAFGKDAQFETSEMKAVPLRQRTTKSGKQQSSLETLPLTPTQRQAVKVVAGQRLSGQHLARWNAASNPQEVRDMAEVSRLWSLGTPAEKQQARDLAREVFDRHVGRFWNAERSAAGPRNPSPTSGFNDDFTAAGMRYDLTKSGAPRYLLPSGEQTGMTLDHNVRLSDDPTQALNGNNLSFVLDDENSVTLEAIRNQDPFQR